MSIRIEWSHVWRPLAYFVWLVIVMFMLYVATFVSWAWYLKFITYFLGLIFSYLALLWGTLNGDMYNLVRIEPILKWKKTKKLKKSGVECVSRKALFFTAGRKRVRRRL